MTHLQVQEAMAQMYGREGEASRAARNGSPFGVPALSESRGSKWAADHALVQREGASLPWALLTLYADRGIPGARAAAKAKREAEKREADRTRERRQREREQGKPIGDDHHHRCRVAAKARRRQQSVEAKRQQRMGNREAQRDQRRRATQRARESLRLAAELGLLPSRRAQVYDRDGFACVVCGANDDAVLSLDHVVPRCRGGPNTVENMQTMCSPCNNAKGARMPSRRARA